MDTAVVGRDAELEAIEHWLDEPRPPVLLLEGEAGIGKTTLWRAGVDEARKREYRVLVCTAGRSETQLAFTALRDLVTDAFDDVADELPAPQRRALGVILLLEDPDGLPPERGTIAVAFLTALRTLAARTPTLLAIDDVQWLDAASAASMAFAVRRLGDEPLAFLVARRSGGADTLDLERLESGRVHDLSLEPLTIGALGRILHGRLGASHPRPTLHRIHEVSGGNPFFALELARALGHSPKPLPPGAPLPMPTTLRELVLDRLTALPADALDTLAFVSATARPSPELLDAALEGDAGAALLAAIDAHLVEADADEVRFVHPLFAAAAYDHAGPVRRREIHQRLAEVVPDVEERARHLALATEEPDEAVALIVQEGARAAFARGAPATAAELLELAIGVSPQVPPERLLQRKKELADYHLVARNLGEAAGVLEELVGKLPPGTERADALLKLARTLDDENFEVSRDSRRELVETALADAQGDDGSVARIECYLTRTSFAQGFPTEALQHARAAVQAAERAADNRWLSQALTVLAWLETLGFVEVNPSVLERALALDDGSVRPIYGDPGLLLGLRLMYAGKLDEARERLTLVGAHALSTGDEMVQSGILVHLTELECRAGNWQVAARHVAELVGQHQALSGLQYARALVAAHLGQVEDARQAAELGIELAETAGTEFFRALNLSVLGFLELSVGDHAAADRILRPLSAWLASSGSQEPSVYGELPNAIETLVELGELSEAERLLAELQGRLTTIESPWGVASAARCHGMILTAQADLGRALAAYERALLVHERLPQPFDRARTLLALGRTQRRARQRKAARDTLQSALAIFEELGAELWAKKARTELARIGGRAASSGELTPTEERVAALVAEGKSNKEVAAELVVSVSTVESTLTSIYRKLDVRSRTEMARKLPAAESRSTD